MPCPPKTRKRERSKEFLEAALSRAQKILNPRDYAVIFQAARASAGGQVSARRRRERMTAGESHMVEKTPLAVMNLAELEDLSRALNSAYGRAQKTGRDTSRILIQAKPLLVEYRGRDLIPTGQVYDALGQVKKGFADGCPDGGMHAHGLDRRNSKTLDDGGHIHIWKVPSTGEILTSHEDGNHEHIILSTTAKVGGTHSHHVMLPNGAMVETKLGGEHTHELMVETSGFGGLHTHKLVMADGSELESLSVLGILEEIYGDAEPRGYPLEYASAISRAMNDLRAFAEEQSAGGPLPQSLPDLDEAVELAAKGEKLSPPVFAVEVDDPPQFDFEAEAGDILDVRADGEVVGFSKHVLQDTQEDIDRNLLHWHLVQKHTTPVGFTGPEDARLMFVCAAPNELELARKRAMVGEDALTFQELYLDPLGLKRKEVAVGFAMPVVPHGDLNAALCEKWSHQLVEAMKTYGRAKVVALGKVAREVLSGAGVEYSSLPHPSAVRKRGNSGEVSRKLKAISKLLDGMTPTVQDEKHQGSEPSQGGAPGNLTDAISEMRKTGRATCRVIKSAGEKQIVYGVVLDPYAVDLQSDWIPPAEIESTAHGFLKKSRVIGFEHVERADAQLVESWVEVYPSPDDYKAAKANQPHRAFTRKFGDDVIHSGTWVAGVQLGDTEWELHKQGKLNAFSVGGFSFKTKVTTAAMPEVEFIELIEAPV